MENTLKPLTESAKNGKIQLFFMDASHFVMGCFAGKVWSKIRVWVKTGSGRKRFNVLGALNFVTKKMETITNDTYITSAEVVEMLVKLSEKFKGEIIKILLDNAAYQRCRLVTEKAAELGIELVFLPSYSPNLNLIERAWKLVKSCVLSVVYHETFLSFRTDIENCISSLETSKKTDMDSLITDNFQLFQNKSAG